MIKYVNTWSLWCAVYPQWINSFEEYPFRWTTRNSIFERTSTRMINFKRHNICPSMRLKGIYVIFLFFEFFRQWNKITRRQFNLVLCTIEKKNPQRKSQIKIISNLINGCIKDTLHRITLWLLIIILIEVFAWNFINKPLPSIHPFILFIVLSYFQVISGHLRPRKGLEMLFIR